jgi:signal transduction histidine kinase
MLVNALEATPDGGEVRVWLEQAQGTVSFCVWNSLFIPEETARRVFERNFTTKMEPGRGVGTFAMRLFAESSLGGRVDFTTSEKEGTVFRLTLPA